MRSWHNKCSELRDLRALRGDKLFDHEGREALEGRVKGTWRLGEKNLLLAFS